MAETIPLLSTNESEGGGDNNRRPTNRKRGYNAGKYKQNTNIYKSEYKQMGNKLKNMESALV